MDKVDVTLEMGKRAERAAISSETFTLSTLYKASHVLIDLGWVDLVPPAGGPLL